MDQIATVQGATANGEGHDDISDEEFGYQVVLGAVVGIVVTFVVLTVGFIVFTGINSATVAAAWAAIVGGGFFGGTVTVNLALGRIEAAEKAERLARQATTTSPGAPAKAA